MVNGPPLLPPELLLPELLLLPPELLLLELPLLDPELLPELEPPLELDPLLELELLLEPPLPAARNAAICITHQVADDCVAVAL